MNTDQRTDEQLNRIIAEWCGWKWHDHPECMAQKVGWRMPEKWLMHPDGKLGFLHDVPNYCQDLNACHQAEGKLDPDGCGFTRWTSYANSLCQITGSHRACIHATARQRAEALVKVIEQQKGQG